MSSTRASRPLLPLRQAAPHTGRRAPAPILAQVQTITVHGGSRSRACDLLAALRERAADHPGYFGLVEMTALRDHSSAAHASFWRSVSDLRGFVHASHADIVAWKRRTGLHLTTERALWWVSTQECVTVTEAHARMDHLRRHGPTRHAFTLRSQVPPPDL